MGTASSSALRDDAAVNGPAYGSLESLGGPRKFKKKPVLVLDPEELEAAHAAFHEASAELLGEEVERAPRPAMILGLAPMVEDDPEELGESDEVAADAEDDLPSPDAVLALTRLSTPNIAEDEASAYPAQETDEAGETDEGAKPEFETAKHEEPAEPEAEAAEAEGDDALAENYIGPDFGPILDDSDIDDGLDLSKRIFPSLPLRPELREAAETPAADAPAPEPERVEPVAEKEADPVIRVEVLGRPPRDETPVEPPVTNALVEETAPTSDDFETRGEQLDPEPLASELPPVEQADETEAAPDEAIEEPSTTTTEDTEPKPARFDELNPARLRDDEIFDLDAWLNEPQGNSPVAPASSDADTNADADATEESASGSPYPQFSIAPIPPSPPASGSDEDEKLPIDDEWLAEHDQDEFDNEPEPQPASDAFELHALGDGEGDSGDEAEDGSFTVTLDEDDVVDGYAFMRDPRSRRDAISAAAPGTQSSLRARLLHEAEAEADVADFDEQDEPQPRSLLLRWWHAFLRLF